MKVEKIKKFLKASYSSDDSNISDYEIDKQLSNKFAKVYHNKTNGSAVIVHRGTASKNDILTDAAMVAGYENTTRFRRAKKYQLQAEAKYGNKILTLGHSLGGRIAEKVANPESKVITYNKAVVGRSLFETKKQNQTDIRARGDVVSFLSHLEARKGKLLTVDPHSLNPLTNHKLNHLNLIRDISIGNNSPPSLLTPVINSMKSYITHTLHDHVKTSATNFIDRKLNETLSPEIVPIVTEVASKVLDNINFNKKDEL